MAADLELRLPSTVKINSDHRSTPDITVLDDERPKINGEPELVCHTPTSPHHAIPAVSTCPPAPKKRRPAAPSCKRKLFDLPFFEKAARDEVEALFRSTANGSIKRKCVA